MTYKVLQPLHLLRLSLRRPILARGLFSPSKACRRAPPHPTSHGRILFSPTLCTPSGIGLSPGRADTCLAGSCRSSSGIGKSSSAGIGAGGGRRRWDWWHYCWRCTFPIVGRGNSSKGKGGNETVVVPLMAGSFVSSSHELGGQAGRAGARDSFKNFSGCHSHAATVLQSSLRTREGVTRYR